jgi:hypothetical protein
MSTNWYKYLGGFAITSPLAMAIGYAILMVRSGQGPDFGWFLSHIVMLIGIGLMLPTIIGIRVLLLKTTSSASDLGMIITFFGGLTLVGQFAIDLAIGQLSVAQSEMIDLFKLLSASPIISVIFQSVGPILFYIGLLILIILLWQNHIISWQAGIIASLGAIAVGGGAVTGIALITLLGFMGIFVGFIFIGQKFFVYPPEDNVLNGNR